MKIWILKAFVQKIISFLPFKHKINYFFQKNISKKLYLTDSHFEEKLNHSKNHLSYYTKYSTVKNGTSLEIGTGWYPVVPICLYLSGFKKIVSMDLDSLLNTQSLHDTINKFIQYHESGLLHHFLPKIDETRFLTLKGLLNDFSHPSSSLKNLNVELVVGDARHTSFGNNTFDLITSNNTFEHIYPDILVDILKEFYRVLKADGIMSHHIDPSDHFFYIDKTISRYNFLQFSESQWKWIDNSIQPQNRLRKSDYIKLFLSTNFLILDQKDIAGKIEEIRSINLSKYYKNYGIEDILIYDTFIIAHK